MDLSIIIINWKSREFLRDCLRTLDSGLADIETETIVIDNASFDGCQKMLACEFPAVRFIQSQKNLGFAGGNNSCARAARGDLLLFLNPDTEVEPDAIPAMVAAIRQLPEAGAVGARLLNTDRTVQTSCIQSFPTVLNQMLDTEALRRRSPRSRLWGMAPLFDGSDAPSPVEAISGACFMITRPLYERVGGFDERYFMYSEDLDLSFKIHQAGWKCYFVPKAAVVHHGGGSSKSARSAFSTVMMRESVYRFMRIRRGRLSAALFRVVLGLSATARVPLALAAALLAHGDKAGPKGTLRKWTAILRWSVGLESWTQRPQSP